MQSSVVHLSLECAAVWASACWKAVTLPVFLQWFPKLVEDEEGLKLISAH